MQKWRADNIIIESLDKWKSFAYRLMMVSSKTGTINNQLDKSFFCQRLGKNVKTDCFWHESAFVVMLFIKPSCHCLAKESLSIIWVFKYWLKLTNISIQCFIVTPENKTHFDYFVLKKSFNREKTLQSELFTRTQIIICFLPSVLCLFYSCKVRNIREVEKTFSKRVSNIEYVRVKRRYILQV